MKVYLFCESYDREEIGQTLRGKGFITSRDPRYCFERDSVFVDTYNPESGKIGATSNFFLHQRHCNRSSAYNTLQELVELLQPTDIQNWNAEPIFQELLRTDRKTTDTPDLRVVQAVGTY